MNWDKQEYTPYQVKVLMVYALISLPLLPFCAIIYPFSKWAMVGKGKNPELSVLEFLVTSMAVSLFMYLYAGLVYLFSPPHH